MSGDILEIGQGGDDEASRDVEEVIVTDGKVSQMVEKEILPDPTESKVKSPVKMVSKGIQVDVQPPPYRYSDLCNNLQVCFTNQDFVVQICSKKCYFP